MILVTAPTGQIGRHLIPLLLAAGQEVRVIVRSARSLEPAIRDHVDVVVGSHSDAGVIRSAMVGVSDLFWLVPLHGAAQSAYQGYVGFSLPAAHAVVEYGVGRVVTISALGRSAVGRASVPAHAGLSSVAWAMDDLFRSTGSHLRAIAPPTYMDNTLWQWDSLMSEGVLRGTLPGDLELPLIATRDVAQAAADLLTNPTWTGQEDVPLLGAEEVSPEAMATVLSEALGKPITYERHDRETEQRFLIESGYTPAMAASMMAMDVAKERGLDSSLRRTAANTTATTYSAWAAGVFSNVSLPEC